MFYADDLVLTAESNKVNSMFMKWKGAMELQGSKTKIKKTKYMVSGKIIFNKVNWGRWPCGCCGEGVGSNSIICNKCKKWCHKRCSSLKNIILDDNFICPKCNSNKSHSTNDSERSFELEDGEMIEVESFNYLGNCFDCDYGLKRKVRGRFDAAWLTWRNTSGLLRNNIIPLKYRSNLFYYMRVRHGL